MGKPRWIKGKRGQFAGAVGGAGETPPAAASTRIPAEAAAVWDTTKRATPTSVPAAVGARVSGDATELWAGQRDDHPRRGMLTSLGAPTSPSTDIDKALYGTPGQQLAANFRLEEIEGDYTVDEDTCTATMGRAKVTWNAGKAAYVVTGKSRVRPAPGRDFVDVDKEVFTTGSASEAAQAAARISSNGVDGYHLMNALDDEGYSYTVDKEGRVALSDGATYIEWSPDSNSGYVVTTWVQTRAADYWEPAEYEEHELLHTDDAEEAVSGAINAGYDPYQDDYEERDDWYVSGDY